MKSLRKMGVESPFAVDNEEKYVQARKLLSMIDTDIEVSKIDQALDEITDPGLRAFLELNKLSKGKK